MIRLFVFFTLSIMLFSILSFIGSTTNNVADTWEQAAIYHCKINKMCK